MRSTIALSCLVAFAAAQDYTTTQTDFSEYEMETEPSTISKIVEVNPDTGRYELALPEFPHISVAPVNETDVKQWGTDVEAEYAANDQEWASAWQDYSAAIAQPWNDFVSSAQEIGMARDQLDFSNTEDVFRFVTDNVFMDGKSLSETFASEIDEIVEQMYSEGTKESEKYAAMMDKIRAPVSMQMGVYNPPTPEGERICVYEQYPPYCSVYADEAPYIEEGCVQMGFNGYYGEWYCEIFEESAWEKFVDLVVGRAKDAGFNENDVEDWTEETMDSFKELKSRHDAEAAELAMNQTRQAADYAKSVVDEMIANFRMDLSDMMDREEAEAEFSGYLEEIEQKRDEMLENLQNWADQGYDEIVDMSEEAEQYFDNSTDDSEIALAQVQFESESSNNSNYAYGFGAVALGAAAAAYFYNKKEQAKIQVSNESEFLLV